MLQGSSGLSSIGWLLTSNSVLVEEFLENNKIAEQPRGFAFWRLPRRL